MWIRPSGRQLAAAAALVAGLTLAVAPATSAAAPATSAAAPATSAAAQPGDEGSNPTLLQVLESATKGYLDAQTALGSSRQRQAELTQRATTVQAELAVRAQEAAVIAATAYRSNPLSAASALLESASPAVLMNRATALDNMAARNDRKLHELHNLRKELDATRGAIEAEVAQQEKQVAEMAAKKAEAEKALATVGGRATAGTVSANSPVAESAPRGANGSWPPEGCTINDPTTSGCITPRMLHALQQARAAGFTRFTSCYRPGGPYEHPKGRACDFSAQASGFGGVAAGGDRVYGNNLAAYFVRNANQLAVLYVIWFQQIWTPATGWRAYGGGSGDPSSNHTNHVHLSVY
jgi:peptidoglycan DL-endopeptidase CwlO